MAKLSNKDLLLEIQRDLQEIKKNIFVMKTDVNQIKSYIQIKRSEVKEDKRRMVLVIIY